MKNPLPLLPLLPVSSPSRVSNEFSIVFLELCPWNCPEGCVPGGCWLGAKSRRSFTQRTKEPTAMRAKRLLTIIITVESTLEQHIVRFI
jgi:hypothetical protein